MNIQVVEMRLLPGDKALKGFADIKLDGILIREFRVIKENGKHPWIVSPQISWKDQGGQIKYKTILTLPDELKGEIDRIILNRFTEEMEKKNGNQR
jgi:DNA-binding cell septation regulator SpoVG